MPLFVSLTKICIRPEHTYYKDQHTPYHPPPPRPYMPPRFPHPMGRRHLPPPPRFGHPYRFFRPPFPPGCPPAMPPRPYVQEKR